MMNIFVNATNNTTSSRLLSETNPVRLWQERSVDEVAIAIHTIYRQVLGNAHVMESERSVTLESQLKGSEISVREFIRRLAKSDLYRSRFFENCARYRTIELNFKHLLGRAPESFDEMREHSAILDQEGFEAEIDSYLDSEEYQQEFGEDVVPYYRGYRTQPGQAMLGFTNMLQLMRGSAGSDKDTAFGNKPRLTRSLILNKPYGIERSTDAKDILANVFQTSDAPAAPSYSSFYVSQEDQSMRQKHQEQERLIASLEKQLAELRPFASVGSAVLRQSQFGGTAETVAGSLSRSAAYGELQRSLEAQNTRIRELQGQLMEARSLATIGEARLNRWRQRTFF